MCVLPGLLPGGVGERRDMVSGGALFTDTACESALTHLSLPLVHRLAQSTGRVSFTVEGLSCTRELTWFNLSSRVANALWTFLCQPLVFLVCRCDGRSDLCQGLADLQEMLPS